MFRDQNSGQDSNTQIGNKCFETVEEFKYLETTLTNKNSIYKEIKNRLKSKNACYHSAQNFLSSSLLSKNVKITIYSIITLPIVLYGCETWSHTLREQRHNKMLYALYSSPDIIGVIKSRKLRCAGHVAGMGER